MKGPRALILLLAAGCGSAPPAPGADGGAGGGGTGVFRVTGTVSSAAAFGAGKIVDTVMAVNPSSQNPARVVATVSSSGAFSIELDPGRPWVLVFIDSTRVGADMIAGVFRADALDTLAPSVEEGEADLGEVTVSAGEAAAGIAYSDLLAALGIDEATAGFLGEIDDLCLRYVNPDVDGDGVLDVEQPDRRFMLDFHVHHSLRVNGQDVSVADLVDAWLDPATSSITFGGTGIYVAFPQSFAADLSAAWASFEEPAYFQTFGGGATAGSAGAFTPISGSSLIVNDFGDYRSFGIYAPPGHELPQGTYSFGVEDEVLSFTRVATRTDAELASAENFLLPIIRLEKADPACASDCAIGSASYRWVKETGGTWVDASEEEVLLTLGDSGGYLSVRRDYDDGAAGFGISIPPVPVAGALSWAQANVEGMTAEEISSMTASQFCHVGLSYDDKLGMRMFSGIRNAPGTCPMTP